MAEPQFRTIYGVVQFDPRDGKAGDKVVRNITIRTSGVKEQSLRVSATLWPSHEHVEVAKGDVVTLEGKFSRNQGEKDGEKVFYNNLSVTGIHVHGRMDEGKKIDTVNTSTSSSEADEVEEDDIPY